MLLCFRGSSLIVTGDYGGIPLHPAQMAGEYLSPWNFWTDTGNALPFVISNQITPIDFLFYLAAEQAGLSALAAEQAYAVLFSYFLGAYGTYLLVRILFGTVQTPRRIAAVVGGVFYVLNPLYVYNSGASAVLGSSIPRSALPLALFLLVAGFKKRDLRYALALGLGSVLLFAVFARAMEAVFFVVIAAILALPYARRFLKQPGSLKFSGAFFASSTLVALAANLFWIVPFLGNFSTFLAQISSFQTGFVSFESKFTTLANVFRLQGNWPLYVGTYIPYASYFNIPAVVAATFALPVLVIAALVGDGTWQPERMSMALLLILFLGLSMGTNLPLNLYETLLAQVPYFKLFKDPWVFLEPLAVVYSILFGLALERLAVSLKNRIHPKVPTKAVSLAIAFVLLGTISAPILTGEASVDWYNPTQRGVAIPSDYAELNAWLSTHACDCATLLVPQLTGSYVSTNWGYQGTSAFYRNMLPGRLITGAGSFYGLQSSTVTEFLNYVYMLLSFGDPTSTPVPLNDSLQPGSWTVWSGGPAGTWFMNASSERTPWNGTSLQWTFAYPPGGLDDWYTAFYTPNTTLDLSGMQWVDLWFNSSLELGDFVIEIQDASGAAGSYFPGQHVLMRTGPWALLALPVNRPDLRQFNQSAVSRIIINYVAPPLETTPLTIPATVAFGDLELSSGKVPPGILEDLLRELNVGYVLLDNSINNDLYLGEDPRPYARTLGNLSDLPEVQRFGDLVLYQTADAGAFMSIPSSWVRISNLYSLPTELIKGAPSNGPKAFVLEESTATARFLSSAQLEGQRRMGPTDLSVAVDAHGEFLLVLSTTYDSGWQASVNGQAVGRHVVADGYANGWIINYTGNVTISIAYAGEPAFDAGLTISVVSILSAIVVLVVDPRRLRRIAQDLCKRLKGLRP